MKKLFTTFSLLVAFVAFSFAGNSTLYAFTKTEDADAVLKVLNAELTLTQTQFTQVRDLLYGSARSQSELLKSEKGKDPVYAEAVVTRQSAHIEANLKSLIGEDKYKIYDSKKADIEKKVAEVKSKLKN